jgi:hypothetical protein
MEQRRHEEDLKLLPSEAWPDHPGQLDAEHWVTVYEELVGFCENVASGPGASWESTDLDQRLGQYRGRLRHWRQQLAEGR